MSLIFLLISLFIASFSLVSFYFYFLLIRFFTLFLTFFSEFSFVFYQTFGLGKFLDLNHSFSYMFLLSPFPHRNRDRRHIKSIESFAFH